MGVACYAPTNPIYITSHIRLAAMGGVRMQMGVACCAPTNPIYISFHHPPCGDGRSMLRPYKPHLHYIPHPPCGDGRSMLRPYGRQNVDTISPESKATPPAGGANCGFSTLNPYRRPNAPSGVTLTEWVGALHATPQSPFRRHPTILPPGCLSP